MGVNGLTVEAASAFDMLEVLDDCGRRPRFTRARFGEAARQVAGSEAVAIRAGEHLSAVVGLWPEGDHLEAWLAVGPAFRPNLRGTMALALALLETQAALVGRVEVRAWIQPGDRVAGARLAAWLGFVGAGEEETPIGPMQVFRRRFEAEHAWPVE